MTRERRSNEEQIALWNGAAARGWIEAQATLDAMYRPFADLLAEPMSLGSGDRVLDVGCGTGGATLAVARRLGSVGRCVGVDISEPMLAAARAEAARQGASARFIVADAQTYPFELDGFDRIVSRFGVMFFDDPVAAFLNLRCAARSGAELRFVAWRSAAENPFMTAAERAAAPLMRDLPPRRHDAPGQFAFADPTRMASILRRSAWVDIDVRPVDVTCVFPERELVPYLTVMGPVGRILQTAAERERARIIEAVRPGFDPYVQGPEVRFVAACWLVDARAQ
jgi:SAM-dependent methyltransferase